MNKNYRLRVGVCLAALGVAGFATSAEAKTQRHGHKRTAAALHNHDAGEISELKAQLNALQTRLDAQEAAQRITADQASAATASAQATQAKVAQVSTQLASNSAAVSGQIKSAINANAASSSGTTVSGLLFLNASNLVLRSVDGAGVQNTNAPSGTGVDIKRAYLAVDHKFNKTFSANLTTDFNASGAYSKNVALSGANVYIKFAYLQAKFGDPLTVRLGAAALPWIGYVDSITGTRYIEQSITDRLKLGSTADYGVHVFGTIGNSKGLSLSYAASAINGGGFKNPTRTNSVDLEGRVSVAYHGLNAGVGGYTGKLAGDVQAVATPIRTSSRVDALLAYKGSIAKHAFTIGGEYFWTKNNNFLSALTIAQPETFSDGYSGFASVNVTPKILLFGRYDWSRPNALAVRAANSPYSHESFYNLGASYAATKGVDIALVYKHDRLSSANPGVSAANLTTQDAILAPGPVVGGVAGKASYNEIGVFTQVRF